MPFDQVEQLPDLVGFHLALHFLEVEEFRNVGMSEDVVTPLDSLDPKSKRFGQPEKIAKPHIVRSQEDSLEKPSRFHSTRNPLGEVGCYGEGTAALVRMSSQRLAFGELPIGVRL